MSRYVDPAEESRLVRQKLASVSDVPEVVNGVGKFVILHVGENFIGIWDEHSRDQWGNP